MLIVIKSPTETPPETILKKAKIDRAKVTKDNKSMAYGPYLWLIWGLR